MAQARASSTDLVVAAATRVFLEKGFQSATIDDIAEAAEISKPTVYKYARGKQWLLDHAVQLICDTLLEGQRSLVSAEAPAAVRMQWVIHMTIEYATTYRNSFLLSLSQQTELSESAQDRFRLWARQTTSEFGDLLAQCREEGSFDWPGDIKHAANLMLSMLNSTHRWFYPTTSTEVPALVSEIVHLLSGSLRIPDMSSWPRPELPGIDTSALT